MMLSGGEKGKQEFSKLGKDIQVGTISDQEMSRQPSPRILLTTGPANTSYDLCRLFRTGHRGRLGLSNHDKIA